jgi:hypothetical protein
VIVLPRQREAYERRGFLEPPRPQRAQFVAAAIDHLAPHQQRALASSIFGAPATGRNLPRPASQAERSAILATVRDGTLGLTVLVRARPVQQAARAGASPSHLPEPPPPPAPTATPTVTDTHWVGVRLVDESGQALGQIQLAIEDSKCQPHVRYSDANGRARADGVPPGPVTVRLPEPAAGKR